MVVAGAPSTLSSALRRETRFLHRLAERTGIVSDLLHGRASRRGYAIFLRNLHLIYLQLELELERHPALKALARYEVYRAEAIAADLEHLCGAEWPAKLPLTAVGREYADCITTAAEGTGDRLLGHAYVRYFGDLNGGQILKRLVATSLDLPAASLTFYDFPQIHDLEEFQRSYREALDCSVSWIHEHRRVIEAAVEAFSLNIRLSEAVQCLVINAADPA